MTITGCPIYLPASQQFALQRWLLLLVLLSGMTWVSAAQPNSSTTYGVPLRTSPVMASLLNIDVGGSPGDSFQWVQALKVLGLNKEAHDLQRFLLQAWMARVNNQPGNGSISLEQALVQGVQVSDDALKEAIQKHLAPAINQKLTTVWASTPVPLPDEIDNLKDSLTEELPGFWSYRQRNGQLRGVFLMLGLQNNTSGSSSMPLALLDFTLRLGDPDHDAGLLLKCETPRTAKLELIQPQQTSYFLCRSPLPPQLVKGQTLTGVVNLARQQHHIQLEPGNLVDFRKQATLVSLLAAPHQTQLQAFLATNQGCKQRGNCQDSTDADRNAKATNTTASARVTGTFAAQIKPWLDAGRIFVKIAVLTMLYVVVARWAGLGKAVFLVFAGSAMLAYPTFQSLLDAAHQGRDWGWLVAVMFIPVVVLFPFVAAAFTAGLYKFFYVSDTGQNMNSWLRASIAGGLMLAAAVIIQRLTS